MPTSPEVRPAQELSQVVAAQPLGQGEKPPRLPLLRPARLNQAGGAQPFLGEGRQVRLRNQPIVGGQPAQTVSEPPGQHEEERRYHQRQGKQAPVDNRRRQQRGHAKRQREYAGSRAPARLPGQLRRVVDHARGQFAGAHPVQHVHPHALDMGEDPLRQPCAGSKAQPLRPGSQQPAGADR